MNPLAALPLVLALFQVESSSYPGYSVLYSIDLGHAIVERDDPRRTLRVGYRDTFQVGLSFLVRPSPCVLIMVGFPVVHVTCDPKATQWPLDW
jgi:hypothetical protein